MKTYRLSAVLIVGLFGWLVLPAQGQTRLINLSVRTSAGSGSATLIVGFNITGSANKQVLLRGIGPTLSSFGLTGVVQNPTLQLYSGSTVINQDAAWGGDYGLAQVFASVGAFPLPANSADSAIYQPLAPGAYSAELAGNGIALVELYDADQGIPASNFSNISARSVTGTGSGVLTVGFVISGSDSKNVLIRGIGPTLTSYGVSGALNNAVLQLFDSAGDEIAKNSGWSSAATPPSLFSAAGAFPLPSQSADSALFVGLPAGSYSAEVSGLANTTGTALIELYTVDNPPVPVVTMQPVTSPAAAPPSDAGAGKPAGTADTAPVVIYQTTPIYPLLLRAAGIEGKVLVDFYVMSDGTVASPVAISGTDARLASSSTAAVQQWRFKPGVKNGLLVTTHVQVPIIFTL